MNNSITYIAVDQLIPHPQNPRKQLGDLTELADSIKANGVYQNLTVVDNGDETYTIIIGHRRHAAAKRAGLDKLPCAVAEMTAKQQIETMLLENMQRSDLTVIEEAQGLQLLIDLGDSVEDIKSQTGFSKAKINSRLRLNRFAMESVEKAFKRGATLEDFAKIDKIKDDDLRKKCIERVGTPDFGYTLRNAINKDNWLREKPKIIDALNGIGAVELGSMSQTASWNARQLYKYIYNKSDLNKFLEEVKKYSDQKIQFVDQKASDWIYAEILKPEGEVSAASNSDDRKREEKRFLDEYIKKLEDGFYDYINDFIKNFDESKCVLTPTDNAKLYEVGNLLSFLCKMSFEDGVSAYTGGAVKTLGLTQENDDSKLRIKFEKVIENHPVRYMLALVKTMLALSECADYYSWQIDVKCAEYDKEAAEQQKVIIEKLAEYGFETPEELRIFLDGTHDIYSSEGCRKIIENQFKGESK